MMKVYQLYFLLANNIRYKYTNNHFYQLIEFFDTRFSLRHSWFALTHSEQGRHSLQNPSNILSSRTPRQHKQYFFIDIDMKPFVFAVDQATRLSCCFFLKHSRSTCQEKTGHCCSELSAIYQNFFVSFIFRLNHVLSFTQPPRRKF